MKKNHVVTIVVQEIEAEVEIVIQGEETEVEVEDEIVTAVEKDHVIEIEDEDNCPHSFSSFFVEQPCFIFHLLLSCIFNKLALLQSDVILSLKI